MTWRVVHLNDAVPSLWKNGGGTTRELAAWPLADDWLWRMSVADVTQSGPFSRFEGIERWFAVLEGDGVALTTGGQVHRLTADSQPLQFDGGVATDCDLLGGPTRDFNLMTRRGAVTATMTRVQGKLAWPIAATELIAIYSISTVTSARFNSKLAVLPAHSLIWQVAESSGLLNVETDQALVIRVTMGDPVHGKDTISAKDAS